jgi:hypothetical protein
MFNRYEMNNKICIKDVTAAIFALVFCFLLLSACQPTPEELIVQNKADGELMDKIEATAVESTATAAPISETTQENEQAVDDVYKVIGHEIFEQTLVNGMHLVADADIIMPDTETFPVVKYRRKQFSQSDLDNVTDALIGDKPLYEAEIQMTKAQIEEILIDLRLMLTDDELTEKQKNDITNSIDDWQRQHDEAPDNASLIEKSRKLNEKRQIFGRVLFKEGTYAFVSISPEKIDEEGYDNQLIGIRYSIIGKNNSTDLSSKLSIIKMSELGEISENTRFQERPEYYSPISDWNYDINIESVEEAEGKITMTPDEAIKIAEDTFHNMGAGDDVRVSNVYYLYIPEDAISPKEDIHCYAVELKRYIDGMPIVVKSSSDEGMTPRSNDGSDEFNAGVPYECMSVFISDDGIIDLEWREPIEVVEVMNQSVEIAPYEKISDVFSQELVNSYSTYSWRTEDETTVDKERGITYNRYAYSACELYSIELNYGLARVPNENDYYMAIPLWDFYAKWSDKSVTVLADGSEVVMGGVNNLSLLTINGIDNSRFSRRWGY